MCSRFRDAHISPLNLVIARWLLGLAFFCVSSPRASADAMYCYAGNNFNQFDGGGYVQYSATDSVRGCVTLNVALPSDSGLRDYSANLVSYTFSDGVQTLSGVGNPAPPEYLNIYFATQGGKPSEWSIDIWHHNAWNYAPYEGVAYSWAFIQTFCVTFGGPVPSCRDPYNEPFDRGSPGDPWAGPGWPMGAINNDPGQWYTASNWESPEPSSLILLSWILVPIGVKLQRVHKHRRQAK
jgi:hypothetical protein